ncbi:transcription termination factor 1, mitochondrial [Latimeria chalumnae]|uniref:transcription termination factor 1, mitochondrial n=1 Tax=Latimeria chalumnae TaxID=7897 RepID=UPI0003C13AC3|nr:PREDICTED: transcription termination factor 1, mitochondrial [Latimeria chalumnae]XP_006007028.1 PREDICTED: transcription termination factor 1, mitochondrial [Latimeria chalumnae]XP_006007029.1 PREDICTED: transcription termination factor 1, mitochondrial [Latimeria chalumnae]XP_006007030.1 PREDICTED: transcription termination factor 1, mitochondrial [Latimeria chalumnae]XP_006007031.1 PREDICTED: transcription termination factor 1, mitochondrial [Latimeria chalumnae]|eukprot:XP_006007027.1 PREDICTED: transcription termination factor 1, mitochondrial [Latimeria chalumnae]
MATRVILQAPSLLLCSIGHSQLMKQGTAAQLRLFCFRFWSSDSGKNGCCLKENATVLANLTLMGVDIKMVRKRQPGVLRRMTTNEVGLTQFLKHKGAQPESIASIISRYPRAITRTHSHLEKRWELWRSIFLTDKEILKIIERSPESFFRSSDNENLEKNIHFLGSLGLTPKDLHRMLTTAPRTFSNSFELNRQMVELLQDICVSLGGEDPDSFVKKIITCNVYILIRSTKRVKMNVNFLQKALWLADEELLTLLQGHGGEILDLSHDYVKRSFQSLEKKLLSLGCTRKEVRHFVVSYMPLLYLSPETFANKINCLLEGGIHVKQILEKPRVLDFSRQTLESRIRELKRADYDFREFGINILDSSKKRFEAKLQKLSAVDEV